MITKLLEKLCDELNKLNNEEKIEYINMINQKIGEQLPFEEPINT
ncbi:hypothetical protein [uncultured Methanosphaera sp.]|nr:hypothetical protein [uncultured Methanosphaera sp.]